MDTTPPWILCCTEPPSVATGPDSSAGCSRTGSLPSTGAVPGVFVALPLGVVFGVLPRTTSLPSFG